jgi:acyl transferase domain-containing protein
MMEGVGTGRLAPVVWMFPGQGAQYFRMGRELYEGNETFRSWMERLDDLAAGYVGESIVDIVYDSERPRSEPFEQILYTHPALFMVQYAMAQTLLSEDFPAPDFLLGASLGEFVAAAVAGVASVETMLFDVIKQARLFEAHCGGGAMLVVIDDVDTFHTSPVFSEECELAGVNFDRCFVVSGPRSRILAIASHLKERDITHQLLPVTVAFHSSLVDNIEEIFVRMFSGRAWHPAGIPIISCAVSPGDPTGQESARFSPGYWWRVVRQAIEFKRTLTDFERGHRQAIYLDLGPSGNMATFARYNLTASAHGRVMPVMTPWGHDCESIETARNRLSALLGRGAG